MNLALSGRIIFRWASIIRSKLALALTNRTRINAFIALALALGKVLSKPYLHFFLSLNSLLEWNQNWLLERPLDQPSPLKSMFPCLFSITLRKYCPVSSFCSSRNNWNFHLKRDLRKRKLAGSHPCYSFCITCLFTPDLRTLGFGPFLRPIFLWALSSLECQHFFPHKRV